ncbi:MAG TPA: restriction endonuclease subunit S [Alicycliphilus sp.]|nr:restriction endonuclease subunit S [Alicycliphilus sp.]
MSFAKYPAYKDSGVDWLGEVPGHWDVARMRFVARVQTGVAKGKDNTGRTTLQVPYLRVANVQDGYLDLDNVATIEIPADDLPRYELQTGDVLMNEGGDFDKLGRGHIWEGSISPCIHQNHVFAVRPFAVSSQWLNLVTGSAYAQFYFMSRAKQSTNLASISSTNIMELPVVLPPANERQVIATFLDRETAKIDALVAEQEKLIALLQEKRQAVISHAVTKGLDPDVAMKDSGVEWLGEVPAHWDVRRVRNLSSFLTSGPRGWSERISEVGAKFIQSGDLTDDLSIAFDEAKRVAVNDDAEAARTKLADGDVVVCITGAKTGNVAVCGVVAEDAYVNQHLCLIRPRPDVLPDLLAIYLKSDAGQRYFAVAQYGLKQGMSLENIKEAPVPVPPIHEQRQIVDVARDASTNIGALVNEAQSAITLLQERRTALISAAVTGQIDVRGWENS